ncbi:MAG: GTP pyrophosphokinase family protein [Clostridia bacterium]|nr:GTP pyrophosphokinase family protein [Clostridia bacterium]
MEENFYEGSIVLLEGAIANINAKLDIIRKYRLINGKQDPISHIVSRVKSEESMKEKLKRKGFEVTLENALTKVYDAAGMRIICNYIDDVYEVAEMLKHYQDLKVVKEKDYIKNPKPNGYRSYHIIFELSLDLAGEITPVYVEIQIRTIAMDFWSSLEHEMKYKKNVKNPELIVEELRRCADEIATTDLNMQTIKKMIDARGDDE